MMDRRTSCIALIVLVAALGSSCSKPEQGKRGADTASRPSDQSESLVLPPIDLSRFELQSGGNGEGYSGPDLVFDPIPLSPDRLEALRQIDLAKHLCLSEGDNKRGLFPLVLKLQGMIYGAKDLDLLEVLRSRAESALGEDSMFFHPFPKFELMNSISGLELLPDGRFFLDDFSAPLGMKYLDPHSNRVRSLILKEDLPFFLYSPGGFAYDSSSFEPWLYGNSLFLYPGSSLAKAAPLYYSTGERSPYHINFQDLHECILGESQLLLAEAASEKPKANRQDRRQFPEWFVKNFKGEMKTAQGARIKISEDKSVRISFDFSIPETGERCDQEVLGTIVDVYKPLDVPEWERLFPKVDAINSEEEFVVDMQFDRLISKGELAPLGPLDSANGCFNAPSSPFSRSLGIRQATETIGESQKSQWFWEVSWPVFETTATQLQVWEIQPTIWEKSDGQRIAQPHPPKEPTYSADLCSPLKKWMDSRWNTAVLSTETESERIELAQREYEMRRAVARDLFELYMIQGELAPELFDHCLQANGERQNFLHTVSAVFLEETFKRLQDLAKNSESKTLSRFLTEYAKIKAQSPPPLFRMTGHKASVSDTESSGGVLRGAPAMFLNVFELKPAEWFMIWIHEMGHYIDKDLKSAVVEGAEIFASIEQDLKAKRRPTDETLRRWLLSGLQRGFWSEYRAWLVSFQVYEEIRIQLPGAVPWLEEALSFRGSNESLKDYSFRLLNALNRSRRDSLAHSVVEDRADLVDEVIEEQLRIEKAQKVRGLLE